MQARKENDNQKWQQFIRNAKNNSATKKTPLQRNLDLAEKAIQYARNKISASATTEGLSLSEAYTIGDNVEKMRHRTFSMDESLRELLAIPNTRTIRFIKRTARAVKLHGIGNCAEYSELAMNFLRKQNVDFAERFMIRDGDHVIVVIGRDLASNSAKPETWGENAVVVDAARNEYYRASETYGKLKCYYSDSNAEKYPNVYYDYTADKMLLVTMRIFKERNCIYQQRLIKECIEKLNLIQETIKLFDYESTIIQNNILYLQQEEKSLLAQKLTDSEMERKLNKWIKQSLREFYGNNIPMYLLFKAEKELTKQAIHYVLTQHQFSAREKEDFLKDISLTRDGKHDSLVKFEQEALVKQFSIK